MNRAQALLFVLFLGCCGDAGTHDREVYASARARWRGPQDVSQWIGAHFEYDHDRAAALASDADDRPAIKTPEELYGDPRGVCVDLARFGVETLRAIDPAADAKYLMFEFDPVVVDGHTFRRHWVATFEREDGLYAFADSNRPGHIAGPYPSLHELATAYAGFRERALVEVRWLDSFKRTKTRRHARAARPRDTR